MDRRAVLSTLGVYAAMALLIGVAVGRAADHSDAEVSFDRLETMVPDDDPGLGAADDGGDPDPDPDLDPDADPDADADPDGDGDGDGDGDADADVDGDADPDLDAGPQTLEEFVAEAVAFIEAARGRAFLQNPVVVTLSDAEFVARLDADLVEEFESDPEAVAVYNAFYRAFGLIGPRESIDEVYRAYGAAGVLGFYDPESDELVVRQVDELSLLTKSIIVHELAHAFDDQHFDLDRPEYEDLVNEIPWSFAAVVEGSASHVETAWSATLSEADRQAMLEEELAFADPAVFARFELAFLWLELSPYQHGEAFIASIAGDGPAAVDAVLVEPPPTSEQVIEPSAYRDGEPALVVIPPPADGEILGEGVGGQVLLDSLFFGNAVDFGGAADGWGGDYFVTWEEEPFTCLRWDLRADTADDLDELEGALSGWVEVTGAGEVTRPGPDVVRVDRCV